MLNIIAAVINQNSKEAKFGIPSSHDVPSMAKANILPSVDDSSCSIYFNGKHMQRPTVEDVIRGQFESLTNVENFYGKYSKIMGFNIRKNNIKYDNDGETNVSY